MDGVRDRWRDWRATARGAVGGAVAFAVVYVVTFVLEYGDAWRSGEFVDGLARFLGPDAGSVLRGVADWLEPDPGQVVAWFVYASHYVPLEFDGAALGQSVSRSVDVQALPVWNGALVFVPPVVLLAAGATVAAAQPSATRAPSWLTGTGLALGYAGAALLVLATATYSRSVGFASVSVAPDPVTVGVNTAAYALAFGTTGAALYAAYGRLKRQSKRDAVESEPVRDE